jgi:inhibitor of KinA sporulation pathway (predicted exonuclease)
VATDSTAFYAELEGWDRARASTFVQETVVPLLDGDTVPLEMGKQALTEWLEERARRTPTTIISDSGFDRWALAELFGSEQLPPNVQWRRVPIAYEALDEATQRLNLRRHHALDDARALRHLVLESQAAPA